MSYSIRFLPTAELYVPDESYTLPHKPRVDTTFEPYDGWCAPAGFEFFVSDVTDDRTVWIGLRKL